MVFKIGHTKLKLRVYSISMLNFIKILRTVEEKLSLDEEACEDLAVKAFQLKLLRGRLDQGNERITTTYAIKRDFTEGDWLDLKNKVSDTFLVYIFSSREKSNRTYIIKRQSTFPSSFWLYMFH